MHSSHNVPRGITPLSSHLSLSSIVAFENEMMIEAVTSSQGGNGCRCRRGGLARHGGGTAADVQAVQAGPGDHHRVPGRPLRLGSPRSRPDDELRQPHFYADIDGKCAPGHLWVRWKWFSDFFSPPEGHADVRERDGARDVGDEQGEWRRRSPPPPPTKSFSGTGAR